jgi:drug/metabolite transporter (DMT)-like permease
MTSPQDSTRSSQKANAAPVSIYLKLTAMMVIWGGTFVAGRMVVQTIGPFSAAFARFAVATICLMLLTIRKENRLPRLQPQQVLPVFVLGFFGIFAYNALFFLGLQSVPASRAALIVTTNPTVIAIAAAFLFQEKLTPTRFLGVLMALLGAVVVISRGQPSSLLTEGIHSGDLYLIGCLFSWVIYTLMGKQVTKTLSPFAATTYACLFGTPLLLIPAWQEGLLKQIQNCSLETGLGILYLGLLGTVVAFWWYSEAIKAIGAAKAAVFINGVPVVALILAALLLREPLPPTLLMGAVLVILGVALTNRR